MSILKAAQKGKLDSVKTAIESGEDVDARDAELLTPLMYAGLYAKQKVCNYLLAVGAKVNAVSKSDWTPLMYAAHGGNRKIVRMLLEAGAKVDARNDYGKTALIEAAFEGHDDVIVELLAAGADIDVVASNPPGATALSEAIRQGRESTAKLLISEGANLRIAETGVESVLVTAGHRGWTELALLAISAGADVNLSPRYGDTPLMAALRFSHADIVKALLLSGADLQIKNGQGDGVLKCMGAVSVDLADLVLSKLRLTKEEENQLFISGICEGNLPLLKFLRARGFSLPQGSLSYGALKGEEMVRFLLSEGVDPNEKDLHRRCPLQVAINYGDLTVTKLLILSGAKEHDLDELGSTALHVAAGAGHTEIVHWLIQQDAEVNALTKNGVSPLMLAAKTGNFQNAKALLSAGADLNLLDSSGVSALGYAAGKWEPSMETVELLLGLGADPNAGPESGRPIMQACSSGFFEERYSKPNSIEKDKLAPYIERLLRAGAKTQIKARGWGNEELTALEFARATRCPEVIEMLIQHGA